MVSTYRGGDDGDDGDDGDGDSDTGGGSSCGGDNSDADSDSRESFSLTFNGGYTCSNAEFRLITASYIRQQNSRRRNVRCTDFSLLLTPC